MIDVGILTTIDRTGDLEKAIKSLANTSVLVGIPSDAEQPHSGSGNVGTEVRRVPTIGNAALGYIHEMGSPSNNLPARPWLSPGVKESQDRWMPYMKQAGEFAFQGNLTSMDKALYAAGLTAQTAVKVRIVAGLAPPLSQRTIDERKRRTGSDDVTPLVDTAQMLNSISFVIRKKGR